MKTSAIAAFAFLILTGCVSSRQARTVQTDEFLGTSAALLRPGIRGEEPLLIYRKPDTNWSSYDTIVLDPIEFRSSVELTAEQLADDQRMADSFHVTLREKLAADYAIVDSPQPRALRLQVAILDRAGANSTLKVVKTVAPYASIADALWTFATGKPGFVGEVSLEYMIHDAQSGELLAAGAHRRVGGNQLGKATFTTWGDVRNILTYWSDLAVYSLCRDRGAADCSRPRSGLLQP